MIEFQTYDYHFPLKGFAVLFWVESVSDEGKLLIPLSNLFQTHKEIIKYARSFEKVFLHQSKKMLPNDYILLVPLTFERLIPLKEEYWRNPTIEYDEITQMHDMLKVFDTPELFEILVVPQAVAESKEKFGVSVPVNSGVNLNNIEDFMYSSKEYVDPKAKNAALYKPEKPYSLNYKTGKVFIKELDDGEIETQKFVN